MILLRPPNLISKASNVAHNAKLTALLIEWFTYLGQSLQIVDLEAADTIY